MGPGCLRAGSAALAHAALCQPEWLAHPAPPWPAPPRRVQWLLLFKALGAALTPAQLGLRVSFVATEAKGRSQAEHMRQFAALLSERRNAVARLSVTAGDWESSWEPELESALHSILHVVQGGPLTVLHLALRGREAPFMGEALQGLPALLQLGYDSSSSDWRYEDSRAPLAGSLTHLSGLRELIVDGESSYRVDALPSSICHITSEREAYGGACLDQVLEGLPAQAQLLSLDSEWYLDPFDNVPALQSLTSLVLRGPLAYWPEDGTAGASLLQAGLQGLSRLKKLRLASLDLPGAALHLAEMPALEVRASC